MLRLDDLMTRGWKIWQDTDEFCFGTDAILLASFAAEKRFSLAADLCCGTGIIPFLLADRAEQAQIQGVDRSEHCIALARQSVELNGLTDRLRFFCEDLRNTFLPPGRCDLVTANPPYFRSCSGFRAKERLAACREEETCTFSDVAGCAGKLLRWGGRFCFIQKPERLAEVLSACSAVHLEPKILRLIVSKPGRSPELILVECKKGAQPGLRIDAPFFLYDASGAETEEFRAVHRF